MYVVGIISIFYVYVIVTVSMDSFVSRYGHLSIPEFYHYEPQELPVVHTVVYVVSPECRCISDERFEQELLNPVCHKIEPLKLKKRVSRKQKPRIKIM